MNAPPSHASSPKRRILHVLTSPPDSFTRDLIQRQSSEDGNRVRVIDMTTATDDAELVEAIFEADTVATW